MKHRSSLESWRFLCVATVTFLSFAASGAEFGIAGFSLDGSLALANAFTNGVVTIEQATDIAGPWTRQKNIFSTNSAAATSLTRSAATTFFRAAALDLANGRVGFTNLTRAYGLLTTIAGAGGSPQNGLNKWDPSFEGGPATNALLSRPHIAQADDAGNIYIADKDAHAVRKVLPDGTIVTVAGTNGPGNGPDEPTPGTQVALNEPNGLWVGGDGTVYILDLMNGKIRRLDTNGLLSTLVTVPGGIFIGRGLWVGDDESLAYICAGTVVKKWTPQDGVTDLATGFVELGNLVVDPGGKLVVADRGGHLVHRIDDDGTTTVIAGNGFTSGGGDGQLATDTGLNEVRGVWFLPTGAYFVCTHRGSQVWYVDTAGYIHLFLNGATSDTHAGDGTWFYEPTEFRVSENRAVTMDREGNVLITENDSGYIRKVRFLPFVP